MSRILGRSASCLLYTSFLEGAKAAEDFAAYATEQGKEAQTATFDSESTSPAAELIAAADSLGVGGFTDVIETENGLYVAKVTSLLDRDATDAKKETIVNSRKSEKFNEVYDGWKKDTKIKVNKDVWAKVDFQDVGVTVKQNEEEPYTCLLYTSCSGYEDSERILGISLKRNT